MCVVGYVSLVVRTWGADLGDGSPISHAIWAQDIFYFAVDFGSLSRMAQDLTRALDDHGPSRKPDSLSFLANSVAVSTLPARFASSFPSLDRQGNPWWHPRMDAMPSLGILLSPSGDSLSAVETPHRSRPATLLGPGPLGSPALLCLRRPARHVCTPLHVCTPRFAHHGLFQRTVGCSRVDAVPLPPGSARDRRALFPQTHLRSSSE